jgi:hypothetical protein
MTHDESVTLIKALMQARTKDELQDKMGECMSQVDATFFSVVNDVTASLRAQGKTAAAQHLTSIGDSLARLRFMI